MGRLNGLAKGLLGVGFITGLSACPSFKEIAPIGKGTSNFSHGGVGSDCLSNEDCAAGLVCEEEVCVDPLAEGANEASVADAGISPENAPWLLSVNNATHELLKINTVTGQTVVLCELDNQTGSYPSTTFSLDGTLYASNSVSNTLEIIDPCSCELTSVGATGFGMIPGITAHGEKIEILFGLGMDEDILLTLDRETGQGTRVGDLGLNFAMSGTTWIGDEGGSLFAINSVDDKLFSIDMDTGAASAIRLLDVNFIIVGIEWHSFNDVLYACTTASDSDTGISSGSILYRISRQTGQGTAIGVLPYSCNNLAAPWVPVPCVEDVPYAD